MEDLQTTHAKSLGGGCHSQKHSGYKRSNHYFAFLSTLSKVIKDEFPPLHGCQPIGFVFYPLNVILVLLTGEFTHCVPPSPSLGVLQLEQRVVGSWQRSLKWRPAGPVTLSGCTRLIQQLSRWMSGVLQSLLLTLQSTVLHLRLWKHRLRWTGWNEVKLLGSVASMLNFSRLVAELKMLRFSLGENKHKLSYSCDIKLFLVTHPDTFVAMETLNLFAMIPFSIRV